MNTGELTLSQITPPVLEEIFKTHTFEPPFPAATDREAWRSVGERLVVQGDSLIAEAEALAREPIPVFSATQYLGFKRNGERRESQFPIDDRRLRLRILTLAECLEGAGRFLDPLLDLIWAICEESSWCRPAHHPDLADIGDPDIDLLAAMTAFDLAEADALLAGRLDPAAAQRLRYEIDHRCFEPFLARNGFHWMFNTPLSRVNNWAAVCNGGIIGAALYLEQDPARLAVLVGKSLRSLDDYLGGFDEDGGTSEGSFCWGFGFGYFTILSHLLECRTGGTFSLWNERTRRIATVPARTQISVRRFVNFSDCAINFTHIPAQLAFLSAWLGLPDLGRIAAHQPPNERERQLPWALRALFWRSDPGLEPFVPAHHDWFSGLQWMISRERPDDPDAMVLAAKGGHNGEMHNQNDVGNFTLDVFGEPLLVDLGKGAFNRKYFEHKGGRYDFLVNASTGHSVPVINGLPQSYGAHHGAVLLAHRQDLLELDISAAYPAEAGLASLHRHIRLDREDSCVEIRDTARFSEVPGTLESVLITLAAVEIAPDTVIIQGSRGMLEVRAEPADVTVEIDEVTDLELEGRAVTVRRICFRLAEPALEQTLRLLIKPRPAITGS